MGFGFQRIAETLGVISLILAHTVLVAIESDATTEAFWELLDVSPQNTTTAATLMNLLISHDYFLDNISAICCILFWHLLLSLLLLEQSNLVFIYIFLKVYLIIILPLMLIVLDLPIVIIRKVRFKEGLPVIYLCQIVRKAIELTLSWFIKLRNIVKI